MPFYEELNPIIYGIIGRIFLRNQNLCKLLYYYPDKSDPNSPTLADLDYNVFAQPDIANTNQLFMRHIFPMPKMPDASTKQYTYLTVTLTGGYTPEDNINFKYVNLVLDIISHLDTWCVRGGCRPYYIMHEIDKDLNNQLTDLPIYNKPWLIGFQPRDYSNYFYGYQVLYKLSVNSNVECMPKPIDLSQFQP